MIFDDVSRLTSARMQAIVADVYNDALERSVGQVPRRPDVVRRVRLQDLREDGMANLREHVVPLEVARPGDAQVAVPMLVGSTRTRFSYGELGEAVSPVPIPMGVENASAVSLDRLAGELSSVESVIVSAEVYATTTLADVRELIVLRGGIAPGTWKHLPWLERLHVASSTSEFTLDGLPTSLRALHVGDILCVRPRDWLEPIRRLHNLERLALTGYLRASVTPLAGLMRLRELHLNGGTGLRPLAALGALERVTLREVKLPNLKEFGAWKRVRKLAVHHLGDLSGIEQLVSLEELELRSIRLGQDLTPLSRLPRLHSLTLRAGAVTRDLSDLRGATGLRRLHLDLGTVQRDAVVRDLDFVRDMTGLEELVMYWGRFERGNLDVLRDKPLRKVFIRGDWSEADAARVRRAHPKREIEIIADRPEQAGRSAPRR